MLLDNLFDFSEIDRYFFELNNRAININLDLDDYLISQQQNIIISQFFTTSFKSRKTSKPFRFNLFEQEITNNLTKEFNTDNIKQPAKTLVAKIRAIDKINYLPIPLDAIYIQDNNETSLSPESDAPVITYSGVAITQADSVLGADLVRNAFPTGFDGTGIKIGVLSDSYNNLGGANNDINSGDLPAEGVTVIQDLSSGGSDEGRAMLQLIHDLAPGASLMFATAFNGQQSFADNIIALAEAGADIIVDDVGYLTAPFFQDGIIAQAVDRVVNDYGVAYFSSAGNSADIAYEATEINFTSDSEGIYSDLFYDFDLSTGVDTRQTITIPQNQQARISLQWDDPFYTPNGVDTDLNIFLLNPTDSSVVAGSANNNITNQTPSEFFSFKNETSQTNFEVVITLANGVAPERIKYIPFDLGYNPDNIYQEYQTDSSTIFGHAAATNGLAVGAVRYNNTNTPEPFTSAGSTTILFEADGTRLANPEIRQKPDITSIDGTDTTFFGSGDFDGTGFPNFFGTSAAAPHAAAVAALVKEANPNYSPAQIYDRLKSTATDIYTPGVDNLTGVGLIDAYDAIFKEYVGTANNDTIFADDRIDIMNGNAGRDRLHGQGGDDIINGGDDVDFIRGGEGNDSIAGDNSDDILYGNENNDTLLGGVGKDILDGSDGNDFLDGEADSDRLLGGAGRDTFVLRAGDLNNIIYDFEDNLDFLGLADGLASNSLTINQTTYTTEILLNTDLLATLVDVTEDVSNNFVSV